MGEKIQFTISLNDILSKDLNSTIAKIREFEKELEKADGKGKKFGKGFSPDLRTIDGLNSRMQRLTSLRDRAFSPDRIKAFNKEIGKTQTQIDKIKFSGMGIGGRVNAMAGQMGLGGIPLGGMAMAGAGALTVGAGANKIFKSAVVASDLTADVRKSTGMSQKEAKDLLSQLTRRDSRTNISDQMGIAKIGGQIGIGKDEIAEFTNVMDKAVVALSDEFTGGAEEVTRSLGAIKKLYKETDKMGVSDALTKIGDTINYLGATGTATGPVITDFVTRMGQMGNLKGSFREMAGMGAAFQEMGLSSDIATGGISNILMVIGKMTKEGANLGKFAKLMGISEKEATKMFNSKPTQFITDFAKSLKGMDNTSITRTMEALKIGTQESVKAISVMADNTDFFAQRMKQSAGEVGSLQKEFDIKNNNLAGSVDKMKNNWDNLFTVWGQSSDGFFKSAVDGLNSGFNLFASSLRSESDIKKEERKKTLPNILKKDAEFVSESALSAKRKGGSFKGSYFSSINILKKEAQSELNQGRKEIENVKFITGGRARNDFEKNLWSEASSKIGNAKGRLMNLQKLENSAKTQFSKEVEDPKKGLEKQFRKKDKEKKTSFDSIGSVENVKPTNYFITINKIETNQNFNTQPSDSMAFGIDFKRKMKEGVEAIMVEAVNDIKIHLKS